MRKRTLLLVLAGLAVLAVGAVAAWPREDRITRENCERITEGMTFAEVEAILGPPGDYRAGPTQPDDPPPFPWFGSGVMPELPRAWRGDHGVIYVHPKGDGDPAIEGYEPADPEKASFASYFEVRRVDHGPLGNLIWRAKRQWRKWFP
jgi:hypothetical protein